MSKAVFIIILLMRLCIPQITEAQYYNITIAKQPYVELDSQIYLAKTPFSPYDDNFTLEPGFHFQFFDKDCYSLLISKNGYISPAGYEMISAFNTYLKDNGTSSTLSYQIIGSANCNNQILKVQWKNMARYCDSSGSSNFNFQLWLYQGSNIIEFHYGSHSDNSTMYSQCNSQTYIKTIYGAYLQDSNRTVSANIDSFPDSGTVFRFVPANEPDLNVIDIFPNPFHDQVNVQKRTGCDTLKIRVYNMSGKLILIDKYSTCPAVIETSAWNNGIYLFLIEDEKGKILQRLKVSKV